MARPLRIEYPGAFYHITSRGNEKRSIFEDDADRKRFILYLERASERYYAVVHTYCLMGNHYHLLLETPKGNLSQIMHFINGSYTTYYNVKNGRVGHLFQGRYRAILVDKDGYATELSRYIHLNPVRAAKVERPEEYGWSSYRAYVGKGERPNWLETAWTLGYFGSEGSGAQRKYKDYVEEGLSEDMKSPLKDVIASTLLGREEFIDWAKRTFIESRQLSRDLPVIRELRIRPTREEIKELAEKEFEGEMREKRRVGMYLCWRYIGDTLKEIGREYGGMSESAVSQAMRRFEAKRKEDRKLDKTLKVLEKRLKGWKVSRV